MNAALAQGPDADAKAISTVQNHYASNVSAAISKSGKASAPHLDFGRRSGLSGRDETAECISFQVENGMRHPIETAPRDGNAVILEDDSNGTYELARWSAQECAWVGENGKLCNITPRYWHAMRRAQNPEDESKSSSPLRMIALFPNLNGAEPPRKTESPNAFGLGTASNSEPVSVASFDKPISPRKAHPGQARRRFAISCGAAMVAASLTSMYFRGEVTTYLTQRADQQDELGVASVPQDTAAPIEQSRKTSLAPEPTLRAADADEGSVLAQVTVGKAATRNPEKEQRAGALESKLSKPGGMVSNSVHYPKKVAEADEGETPLKQTAETDTTELRRSLRQAQDKIPTVENELLRQHNAHPSLSPRQVRRIPRRRLKNSNRQSFFGVFNFAPSRAPLQRSTLGRHSR